MQTTLNFTDRDAKVKQAKADIRLLTYFVGRSQLCAIRDGLRGEEQSFFQEKIAAYSDALRTMPKVYEQDGLGDQAIVHLHYFKGNQDWFITERDMTLVQHQAFGLADLFNDGGELGYISIHELIRFDVELDLYWTPKTLGEVKANR